MLAPGTSKLKSALYEPTSKPLIAAAMINPKTLSLRLWTTACRACWGSNWSFLRISITRTKSGWREKCSRSPSAGKNCSAISDGAWEADPEPNNHLVSDHRCSAPGRKGRSFQAWGLLCLAGNVALGCNALKLC